MDILTKPLLPCPLPLVPPSPLPPPPTYHAQHKHTRYSCGTVWPSHIATREGAMPLSILFYLPSLLQYYSTTVLLVFPSSLLTVQPHPHWHTLIRSVTRDSEGTAALGHYYDPWSNCPGFQPPGFCISLLKLWDRFFSIKCCSSVFSPPPCATRHSPSPLSTVPYGKLGQTDFRHAAAKEKDAGAYCNIESHAPDIPQMRCHTVATESLPNPRPSPSGWTFSLVWLVLTNVLAHHEPSVIVENVSAACSVACFPLERFGHRCHDDNQARSVSNSR
jgi:hypothetical protein